VTAVGPTPAYRWPERDVEARLDRQMQLAWDHVWPYAHENDLTRREAATDIAVARGRQARQSRGLYP
jgi:glutamate dehydrogenase/leucine dehydrogenase